jgi:alkanesulfonate monooxygenase SsuD/methylene tetrahydromethanopterin reductase-like flavin-dependent oxidoreductase (luciferase family)
MQQRPAGVNGVQRAGAASRGLTACRTLNYFTGEVIYRERNAMQYYGFSLAGADRGRPHAQMLGDLLDAVEAADRLGFDGWFFAEHHVDPQFSLTPSPNLLIAAASKRTRRLRLGNMVNVLPFHHPLRVAEEIRMLDLLTAGRLEVGFGRGQVRIEQSAFGTKRDDTVDMFDAAFDLIRRLLLDEAVDYDTPWWRGRAAAVIPEATQRPLPPLWLSAASDISIEKAARLGLNCATALLPRQVADARLAEFKAHWDRYNPAAKGQGRFAITANVAVADTFEQAYAQVTHDFAKKQEHFARSITDRPGDDDRSYLSHRPNYEAFAAADPKTLLANHLLVAGTVEQCREQVAAIRERGIDVLICTFHTPQSDPEFCKRSMELFAREVIAVVERAPQARVAV